MKSQNSSAAIRRMPSSLFVSPRYESADLVESVVERCGAKNIVGCSSAGEFTNETQGDGITWKPIASASCWSRIMPRLLHAECEGRIPLCLIKQIVDAQKLFQPIEQNPAAVGGG